MPIGEGTDPDTGGTYRVVNWYHKGQWYSLDQGNRLTRAQLRDADILTVQVTDQNGNSIYRNFRGPTEDLQRTIDYWKEIGSL